MGMACLEEGKAMGFLVPRGCREKARRHKPAAEGQAALRESWPGAASLAPPCAPWLVRTRLLWGLLFACESPMPTQSAKTEQIRGN